MQALDLVSPPTDSYPAPFCDDGRMVVFFFGYSTELVGEREGLSEIFEYITFLQLINSIDDIELPSR